MSSSIASSYFPLPSFNREKLTGSYFNPKNLMDFSYNFSSPLSPINSSKFKTRNEDFGKCLNHSRNCTEYKPLLNIIFKCAVLAWFQPLIFLLLINTFQAVSFEGETPTPSCRNSSSLSSS